MKFKVLDIIRGTTVDGPGFRTSIYLAGCTHRCEGCHNPQSWDYLSGHDMTLEEIMDVVEEEDFNVTLSGGDPLFDPEACRELTKALKKQGRNIWIYTGYKWEEILADKPMKEAIESADVVVDGPFIIELKDTDLPFRGSLNQRIIDIRESLKSNEIILYNKRHD